MNTPNIHAGRLGRRVGLVGKNRRSNMVDNFIKFSQRCCCKNCIQFKKGEFANKCKLTGRRYGCSDLDSEQMLGAIPCL
jgi:hypothetical protein